MIGFDDGNYQRPIKFEAEEKLESIAQMAKNGEFIKLKKFMQETFGADKKGKCENTMSLPASVYNPLCEFSSMMNEHFNFELGGEKRAGHYAMSSHRLEAIGNEITKCGQVIIGGMFADAARTCYQKGNPLNQNSDDISIPAQDTTKIVTIYPPLNGPIERPIAEKYEFAM